MESAKGQKRLAILGCGNMGRALGLGMIQVENLGLFTFSPSGTRAKELAQDISGTFISNLSELPPSDYYLIACKPFQFPTLAEELKGTLPKESVVISVMAGLTTQKIQEELDHLRVIRCMPNTPVMVGEGVCALFFPAEIEEKERPFIKGLFEKNSKVYTFLKEEEIDILTAFAGSGPGFLFEVANQLEKQLLSYKIEGLNVRELIAQIFWGSSKLMIESSSTTFEELRNQVTSKGGTTEAGLKVLWEFNLENILRETTVKAIEKAKILSRGKEG